MEVTQRFTDRGRLGVALFVLGPLLLLISAWLINSDGFNGYQGTGAGYIPLAVAGLIAMLVSIPLMLTGREYFVKITHIPRESLK